MHPIFIIGFPGSGKTSLARMLAEMLSCRHIDLDLEIEKNTGKSIPEIFDESGEEGFRHIERETLRLFLQASDHVISTGGGTPCFSDNMQAMQTSGTTVYLSCPAEALFECLRLNAGDRPLISGLDDTALRKWIDIELASRERFYRQAHITLHYQQDPPNSHTL